MLKAFSITMVCMLGCATLSIASAAERPRLTPLKGKTRQGRPIRFAAKGDQVRLKRFTIELRCRDGSRLIDDESGFLPTPLRGGGRLRDHQVGSTDAVWIRGRFHGRVLHGAIRVHDRWGRAQCDSRWVRFQARRGNS